MVHLETKIPLLARVMLVDEARVGLHVTIKHKTGEYELYRWDEVSFVRQYRDDPPSAPWGADSIVSSPDAFIAKAIRGARNTYEDKARKAAADIYRDGLTDEQIRAEWEADEGTTNNDEDAP